jgi:hypothetical protein
MLFLSHPLLRSRVVHMAYRWCPRYLDCRCFKFPCTSCSWISSVGQFLSYDWIDARQVTSKAAKRDNALTQMDMWNKRLLLLYPTCSAENLETIRSWLLCYVRRNLLRSLRHYLSHEFSSQWSAVLSTCRQLRCRHRSSGEFRDNINAFLCRQGGNHPAPFG